MVACSVRFMASFWHAYGLTMFFEAMDHSWKLILEDQRSILEEIERQLAGTDFTPPAAQVMRAFQLPVSSIRVLLIGQDPYPIKGVATGLAFEANGVLPRSLSNLMQELASDLGIENPMGNLGSWQNQGVMLLNASLTTVTGQSGSHEKLWRGFIEASISRLDQERSGSLVVLALGNFAKNLAKNVSHATIIESVHPSPLSASRGFFGSKIFSRTNESLIAKGLEPIDWSC